MESSLLTLRSVQARLDHDHDILGDATFLVPGVSLFGELLTALGDSAEFVLLLLRFSDSSVGTYVLSREDHGRMRREDAKVM